MVGCGVNIATVQDELGTALATVDGLRVFAYQPSAIEPPAAIVGWPGPLTFDTTMARGSDRMTIAVWVLVSTADTRAARNALASYLDGADTKSIKNAIDSGTYTAFDSVRVQEATVDSFTVAGVDYLGAAFQLDIIGSGQGEA